MLNMPNILRLLENERQLMPLLKDYVSYIDPKVKEKSIYTEEDMINDVVRDSALYFGDEHYRCLESPDGSVSSFKMDVLSDKQSGSHAIKDAYWSALADCLQKGITPSSIRVISIISDAGSDSQGTHWTTSVATLPIDPSIFDFFKKEISDEILKGSTDINNDIDGKKENTFQKLLNEMKAALQKTYGNEGDIVNNDRLFGVTGIEISHYDSHMPGNPNGNYFDKYKKTLQNLINSNQDIVSVQSKNCKTQIGNTCGDNALYNGFLAGVLGLDPGNEKFQIDSMSLRTHTNNVVQRKQEGNLDEVEEKIKENVRVAKEQVFLQKDSNKIQEAPAFMALQELSKNLKEKYKKKRHSTGFGWLKYFSSEKDTRKTQLEKLQISLNEFIENPQQKLKTLELTLGYLKDELEAESKKLGKSGLYALVVEIEGDVSAIKKIKTQNAYSQDASSKRTLKK